MNNSILEYANLHKNIICVYKPNNTIVVNINVFALITGFDLTVYMKPKVQEYISEENGRLVIKKVELKSGETIKYNFEPYFNYRDTYIIGGYDVIFNLLPTYSNNILFANIISTEFNNEEPIIIRKNYQSTLNGRNTGYYDEEVIIVITFNGKIVEIL